MGFFGDLARGIRDVLFPRRHGDAAAGDGARGDHARGESARRRRPTPLEMAGPGFAAGGTHARRDPDEPNEPEDPDRPAAHKPETETEPDRQS